MLTPKLAFQGLWRVQVAFTLTLNSVPIEPEIK